MNTNLIPNFILQKFKKQQYKGNLSAAVMFLDISGFTKITDSLMNNGKEGTEILSEIINKIYTESIEKIYNNGGFISTFAGDAITSIFPKENDYLLKTFNAAHKIMNILKNKGNQTTKFGDFKITIKIALDLGNIEWNILKTNRNYIYFFKGKALEDCMKLPMIKNKIIFNPKVLELLKNPETITYSKTNPQAFSLNKIVYNKINKSQIDFSETFVSQFIDESILNLENKGEFREIISCFISFETNINFEPALKKIYELSSKFGGYFNKIDFGDKGGIILVIFGAPFSNENLYKRAAEFSFTVCKLDNFTKKIGLSSGIAFTGFIGSKLRQEYSALGKVVNLSARLIEKAAPNEILAEPNFYNNLKDLYTFKLTTNANYKGIKGKTATYKLLGKKLSLPYFNLEDSQLIGRQKEFNQIIKIITPIFKSSYKKLDYDIIYIDGNPGIGKTRFVLEIKKYYQEKTTWFYWPCDEILKKSFNPLNHFLKKYFNQNHLTSTKEKEINFSKKLNRLIQNTTNKKIKQELIRTKSVFKALLNIRPQTGFFNELNAKGQYENTLYTIRNLIRAESLQKPVIIEIEDFHWIDSDSKKLINLIIQDCKKYPIFFITSCRYKSDGSIHSLQNDSIKSKRITLKSMSKNQTKKLLSSELLPYNKSIPTETLNFIYNKSEGNPFFTEQIFLYLKEKNLFNNNYELKSSFFKIPDKINSIIVARIDKLSNRLKAFIKAASVLGREFNITVLSKLINKKEIETNLKNGTKEKIWEPLAELTYIFKHALIHESIYEMQLKKELRNLHRLAAKSIKQVFKDELENYYPDLANHYEKAEIPEKAIIFWEKAADHAKNNFKNEKAIELYEHLLENFKLDNEKYMTIKMQKANICDHIGKWDESKEIYLECSNKAKKENNEKILAQTLSSLGFIALKKGNYEEANLLFKDSLELNIKLNEVEEILHVWNSIGVMHWYLSEFDKAKQYFNKCLKLSKKVKNYDAYHKASSNLGIIHRNFKEYDRALQYYTESLKYHREQNRKYSESQTLGNIGLIHKDKGNFDLAMKYYREKMRISVELGLKAEISNASGYLGSLYSAIGNLSKALDFYKTKLSISNELADKFAIANAYYNIGATHNLSNEYRLAIKYYRKAIFVSNQIQRRWLKLYSLGSIVESLFALNKLLVVEKLIIKTENLAKDLKCDDYLFHMKFFRIKYTYLKDYKSPQNHTVFVNSLNNLLSEVSDKSIPQIKCNIYKEMYQSYLLLDHKEQARKTKEKALKILTDLYSEKSLFEIETMIDEFNEIEKNTISKSN